MYCVHAVVNKYFPPDFDPSKIPRGKKVRSEKTQMKVRMMLPMSVRCNTCGNFMYKVTKFNTRMEDVKGEDYLGIRIYRFYYKCTNCSAEFCMKTDPQTTDYVVEAGATRNYEPWKDRQEAIDAAKKRREKEEKGDAMKALENKTLDSKREMDIMTALDEVKSLKSRHENIDYDTALKALQRAAKDQSGQKTLEEELDEEDERQVKLMLLQQQRGRMVGDMSDGSSISEEDEGNTMVGSNLGIAQDTGHGVDKQFVQETNQRAEQAPTATVGALLKKRLKRAREDVSHQEQEQEQPLGLSLLGNYSSGSSQ